MPKQKSDVFNPGPGILFTKPGQTWTILTDVTVGSSASDGVFSSFNDSKLVNKGNVIGDATGVFFQAQLDGTVVNKEGALISGSFGVYLGGAFSRNMTVKNDGSIVGTALSGVSTADVSNFRVYNTGSIYGEAFGIEVFGTNATKGSVIENSGLVHSSGYGVLASLGSGLTTTVINKKGGTIEGGIYSVAMNNGKLSLHNKGKLKGDVSGAIANADDKIVNEGKIKGNVYLGFGDDVYKNEGGKAGKIFGQTGNDKLIAGKSTDKFVFSGPLNPAFNIDRVKGFESGKDEFFLDRGVFTVLVDGTLPGSAFEKGKQADDFDDRIIYDKKEGKLYYDEDGSLGGFVQVQIAQLDPGQKLKADDFTAMLFA